VWGVAYEIPDDLWEKEVRDHLDHREKGGYSKHTTTFHPKDVVVEGDDKGFEVTLYLGPMDDVQYAGPAPLEEMAATILKSVH
jgi:cation transport protein ChaC